MVYVVLGTLLVWFGMYGQNPGAVLLTAAQGVNVSAVVAKAAVNSALAASSGAMASLVMAYFRWGAQLGGAWLLVHICLTIRCSRQLFVLHTRAHTC